MQVVIKETIKQKLVTLIDINTGQNLVDDNVLRGIGIADNKVSVDLCFSYPVASYKRQLIKWITDELLVIEGVSEVVVNLSWQVKIHKVQHNLAPLKNIKNIIAVGSGKGGVGKSTTAVNLALALKLEGASVGILDADIYGPSQPRMMGIDGKPTVTDDKKIEPLENYGVKTMSIGYLVGKDTPMIWRGPMVSQALQQMLSETNWGELDYLIIDLPPGTGDIQLTLCQKIPVSAAIIVTTPQDIALQDAIKGLNMFKKVNVPVLGIIENMSVHICSQCGHQEHVFGAEGGKKIADEYNTEFLGALPLDRTIREQVDSGKPTVIVDPDSAISDIYLNIARKSAGLLSVQARGFATQFPNIVVEDT